MTAGQRLGVAWGTLVLVALGVVLWATLVMRPAISSGIGAGSTEQSVRLLTDNGPAATSAAADATMVAFLTMPTPTSTATATPVPTATQQVVWQPEPCSTPEPGKLCRVPDRAPPTPTPYPSCYEMPDPGKWCRWWLMDDAPDGRTETR